MTETLDQIQRRICRTYGADYVPPQPGTRVGIAIQTLKRIPTKGIRYLPAGNTCGWYIYGGEEWSDDPVFYQALCIEHLEKYCPVVLPFLCLAPGWGFVTDPNGYIDVWFDRKYLEQ